MLQNEHGRVRSRHVDIEHGTAVSLVVEQVIAEVHADGDESEVRYRAGIRERATLRFSGEEDAWLGTRDRLAFPPEQVLLITGGTRGLGAACARHFVERHGVRRLVLTGREAWPPRETWSQYAGGASPLAAKIAAVQALEAAGAHVHVTSVSLTDAEALRAELDQVARTLGPIGGVLHCAGVVDRETAPFVRKTVEGIQRVMAPKVAGLDTLLGLLANRPPQFIALFSSVASAVPALAVGQADYAAAQAYMDYAAVAYADRFPIVSIQWPSWKDAGMGEAASQVYRATGLTALSTSAGLTLLDRVLAAGTQPVVMPVVVDASWQPERLIGSIRHTKVREARTVAKGNRERSPQSCEVLEGAAEQWVRSIVSRELKMPASHLERDVPLVDYGVDSVMLIQLLRPVADALGTTLDPSVLFEHSSVAAFARWLLGTHTEAMTQLLETGDGVIPPVEVPTESGAALAVATPAFGRQPSDIAVVGMACRFPGGPTLDAYWDLLSTGRSAIRSIPRARGLTTGSGCAGLLDDEPSFDAAFFLIPDTDAGAMDPQAWLVLEEALHAWHHAGYTPRDVRGQSIVRTTRACGVR
jgi:NAD(P)-dependent dehydrogenase (short-subunit alcohol dehydrogenase family)/aryl carrier-like protein